MTTMLLDTKKYKAAFLYMLQSLGKIEGKKKACKLFYFLDFDYYEAYETSFTGETYVSYKMGPFPQYFQPLVEEMQVEGLIQCTTKRREDWHENETITYTSTGTLDFPWTAQERAMLDRIAEKYGALSGGELEDRTHAEAPYNAVDLNEVIPYEFSFYRGTPDLTEAVH
jgi:uncharacterized phage-associated protein